MKTKKYLGIFFAATVIAACSNDRELDYSTASLPVNVTANLQGIEPTTRATLIDSGDETTTDVKSPSFQNSGYFKKDQHVAIYLEEVDSNGDQVTYSNMNYDTPADYVTGEAPASGSQSLSIATAQNFPTSGNKVKLYAFYPYSRFSSVNNRTSAASMDFAVEADQSTIEKYNLSDLMTASAVGSDSKGFRNETAALTFTHKLAKVTIELQKNDGVSKDQLKGATVIINNTKLKANFNMNDMNLVETSEGSGDYTFNNSNAATNIIVMNLSDGIADAEGSNVTGSAIVVPQKVSSGNAFISVTLTSENGGGTFVYKPESDITLAGGTEYKYTIKITNQGLKVENTTITDWSKNNGSGNATL